MCRVRSSLVALAALACAMSATAPSHAAVLVEIEKSTQTMYVTVNGVTRHQWPVSTGRGRFGTPNGVFRPLRLERRWFSRRYYNSPMPYSVFFYKGYAIHGTTELSRLGGPASHGCVRLHPRDSAVRLEGIESRTARSLSYAARRLRPRWFEVARIAPQVDRIADFVHSDHVDLG